MKQTERQGLLLVLAAALGYSLLPIIAKLAYATGIGAVDLLVWRFVVATPLVWLLVGLRRGPAAGAPLPRRMLLAMGVLFAAVALLAFLALERVPASVFIVLLYSYPVFVALLSALAGDRLSARSWAALGLASAGIVLTAPGFGGAVGGADALGVALVLLNSAIYAVYIVLSTRLLRGAADLPRAGALSISGSMLAFAALALVTGLRPPPGLDAWAAVVALVVVSTIMPIYAFYAGLQKLGAPRAAILSTVEPALGLIWSFVLLRETLLPVQLAGAALIVTSGLLLQAGRLRRPRATPRPRVAAGD